MNHERDPKVFTGHERMLPSHCQGCVIVACHLIRHTVSPNEVRQNYRVSLFREYPDQDSNLDLYLPEGLRSLRLYY